MTSSSVYRSATLCMLAVFLSMSVSLADAQFYGKLFGGPHGSSFDDAEGFTFGEHVTRITIRTGERVDMVQFTTNHRTLSHGGSGGSVENLGPNEKIRRYEACWGKKDGHTRVFWIKFVTNADRQIDGGSVTSDCDGYDLPTHTRVFGMHGRSGEEVDKLGMVFN